MAYQGIFPADTFEKTGLPESARSSLEYGGKVNFLKGGICYADSLATVSPTYAKEIMTPQYGCGLEGTIKKNKEKLWGILNGVDTEVWNPATDKLIDTKYTSEELEEKFENKSELAKKFQMEADIDVPMVVMIGRMVEQKGYDLLIESVDRIAGLGVQLVVMGEGEKKYQTALEKAAKKHRNVALHAGYDEELAHLMIAGGDILLMPSKFEPCGLNQLYAFAYGTVPVVHKTGGLTDSVIDFNPKKGVGNGFCFTDYTPDALIEALQRGLALYRDEEKWEELQQSIMAEDHAWKVSAAEYVENLYRK
jgi:starch synthase